MIFTAIEVCHLFHIQLTKYSHFICLHGPKFVSSPVCACVFMCILCFAWGSAMSGPAYRREPPQRNNEELYGGDRMGSRYAVELSPNHLINCAFCHTHTQTRALSHTPTTQAYLQCTDRAADRCHLQATISRGKEQRVHIYSSPANCRLCRQQTNQNVRTNSTHI